MCHLNKAKDERRRKDEIGGRKSEAAEKMKREYVDKKGRIR